MRHGWVRGAGAVAGGVALGAVVFAGVASAHVTVDPSSAPQGAFTAISFRVPCESDKASTTVVDLHLDTTHPVAVVDYQPVPGWTAVVTTSALASPITDDDGNQVTSAVSEVKWTADSAATAIKPGQFLEFPIELGPLPKIASLEFKVLQTYSDGTIVRWIDDTPPGGPEPDNPAPVLTLTPVGGATSAAPTGPVVSAQTNPVTTAAAPSGGSNSAALTIAIVGGLLGLVGAVLGGAAYSRTRGSGSDPS